MHKNDISHQYHTQQFNFLKLLLYAYSCESRLGKKNMYFIFISVLG